MSDAPARIVSRARGSISTLVVGLLLVTGLVLLGAVGSGAWVEGASAGTVPVPPAASSSLAVMQIAGTTESESPARPGHIIIGLEAGAALPDLSGYGLGRASAVGIDDIYALQLSPIGMSVAQVLDKVASLPGVAWAQEEKVLQACVVPNDTFYPPTGLYPQGQWSLPRVGMPEAWDVSTGVAGITVAIIDTGINKDALDFAGRIVHPYNAMTERTDWPEWRDNKGHGTAVAGVAVARGNDGQGMAGTAWNVNIMPIKIADLGETYDYVLARGIKWAVDRGADVINISFAGSSTTTVETAAINYALSNGVVVVAAAGNTGYSVTGNIAFPAALPGVIAVGATSRVPMDSRADFSATGSELDLTAPGKEIISHHIAPHSWALWGGTSFSTPIVTGVVALMLSANPGLTSTEITSILATTADDLGTSGWDANFGWGIIDADEALAWAAGGSTTTSSSSTTSSSTTTSSTTPSSSTTTTTLPTSTTTTVTAPSTTTTTAPRFVDVSPATTPYSEQIEYLARQGIVVGMGDGRFYPDNALMRQQFAKMIVLTMGYNVSETDMAPFGDVSHLQGDLYPYHYVAVAWKNGITQGTKTGYFSPYLNLTRAQMITMVARAAQLPEPPGNYSTAFPNFSSVHYPYARRAASAGLLDALVGMGKDYDFFAPASRGEVCALLYGLLR